MFVAERPAPSQWPDWLLEGGSLVLGAVDDVYAPLRDDDLAGQRGRFATAVAEALRDGFRGIRVVADNTALLGKPRDAERWLAWEPVADELMAATPVTGLCAFDRGRVHPDQLRELRALHGALVET